MKEAQQHKETKERHPRSKDSFSYIHATEGRVALTLRGGITLNRTIPSFVFVENVPGAAELPLDRQQKLRKVAAVTLPIPGFGGMINRSLCVAPFAIALRKTEL
jgi:hypothetical protein